jgi:hypothetical protein
MAAAAALVLVKLLLGIGIFTLIGYIGRFYDKRIAGVLLTFPILNGIGILTGADPLAIANEIYALVVFNGLLLFAAIAAVGLLPPLPRQWPDRAKMAARLATWSALWLAGASAVVTWRDSLPGPALLLALQCVLAVIVVPLAWVPPRHGDASRDYAQSLDAHARAFVAFWRTHGFWRLVAFTGCCAGLLAVAAFGEAKWVGMLSALPLPGLFALASLSVDDDPRDFAAIGDSVLFGPPLVIVFNWLFVHLVVRLAGAPAMLGLVALIALLAANALLIFWIVPRISAYLDGRCAR